MTIWKSEYASTPSDAVFVEGRAGSYLSRGAVTFNSPAPRVGDVGLNTASGGASAFKRLLDRPQVNGSISMEAGWLGRHTLRIGGEYMSDRVDAPFYGYGNPCSCISTLNNGAPTHAICTQRA